MKLLFKNEFAWDGLYWIEDEANVEKYYIDARLSENSRNIYVFDPEHKEVGAIRQKALALKKEYSIYYSNIKEGSVNRILPLYDYDYLVSYKDWMVSGDAYSWNFKGGYSHIYNRKWFSGTGNSGGEVRKAMCSAPDGYCRPAG